MNKFVSLCLCLVWFFLAPTPALTQDNTFVIGVENIDYSPHYQYENGEYSGYARDLFDAFAAARGYVFKYRALPVNRLFSCFLEKQTVDFKYPDNPNWSADMREGKTVVYSQAVQHYIEGAMVLPQRKGMGLEHFEKLGTVLGFTAWDYLDLINAGKVELIETSSTLAVIEMTLRGRVDGAYLEVDVADYTLEHVLKQPGALVFDPGLPYTESAFFLATITYPEVIVDFNEFLNEEQERVNELRDKHGLERQ